MPPNVARLSPEARRACQVGAVLCWTLGTVLVVTALIGYLAGFDGGGSAAQIWMFLLAFPLYIAGSVLGRLGFTKSVSELIASEIVGVTDAAANAVRHGFKGAWVATDATAPTLRVQCRNCGFLESEDASYCTSCRTAL